MSSRSHIAPWPAAGPGKGLLVTAGSGELAVEVWKTDQAGAPTHGEVLEALGFPFDAVLAFFTIDEGQLNVLTSGDADVQSAYRLIVELDARLGPLELQERWDFD
jgi:hypothetical protein